MTDDAGFWEALAAAGPLAGQAGFDPYLVDDVLAAERAALQFDRRKAFIASYAWAIPSPEAVERIAEALRGRKLLEVCAGSGLWAKLLADRGVQVVATDPGLPSVRHFAVELLDAETAVGRHPECDAVMMIWPPFKDDCAAKALRAFKGDRVVYIGDSRFTADQAFHEELAKHWRAIAELRLPSWLGTRDAARVLERSGDG